VEVLGISLKTLYNRLNRYAGQECGSGARLSRASRRAPGVRDSFVYLCHDSLVSGRQTRGATKRVMATPRYIKMPLHIRRNYGILEVLRC
jgi:hypothetical protein